MAPPSVIVFYSPPLRFLGRDGPRWIYETLTVGPDGLGKRMPGEVSFTEAEGRKACAAHVLAQLRVDRDAVRKNGGAVALAAVVDAASWEDICARWGADAGAS